MGALILLVLCLSFIGSLYLPYYIIEKYEKYKKVLVEPHYYFLWIMISISFWGSAMYQLLTWLKV